MSGKGDNRRPTDEKAYSEGMNRIFGTQPFKIVYSGGTHDVWCNGIEHERCDGGLLGKARQDHNEEPNKPLSRFICDCDKYN